MKGKRYNKRILSYGAFINKERFFLLPAIVEGFMKERMKERFYRKLCEESLRVFSPRCGVFVTQGAQRAQGLRVLCEGRAVTSLEA
ncbi:MAG: hypothetical protein LBD35_02030 [Prevotellaceae bacterium]|jgi:hypothetical protein|nr:hypothetical protein [Prevotellaceae bacterium]